MENYIMEKSKICALFDLAARPLLHPLPSHLLLESQSSGGVQGTHTSHPAALLIPTLW